MARWFIVAGLCLAVIYPTTKRYFKYPQFVLGLAFNIGVFVGFSAVFKTITNSCVILYVIGIYWTMFYDTIYAMQDAEEDRKLGINSTAIQYQGREMFHLTKFVIMMLGGLVILGIFEGMNWKYYLFIPLLLLQFISILKLVLKKDILLLQKAFTANIWIGLLIAIQVLVGKL